MAYKFFQAPTPENIERAAAINDASHGPIGSGKDGLRKCSGICGQVSDNMNAAAGIEGKYSEEFVRYGSIAVLFPSKESVVALWKNAFILGVLAGQLQSGAAIEFAPPEIKRTIQ